MIFRPELVEKILAGEKTETRRLMSDNPRSPWSSERCMYRAGQRYSVQPGRGQRSVAQVEATAVLRGQLRTVTNDSAQAEGFFNLAEFRDYWTEMHGHFDPFAKVWVVRFRLADG